MPGKARISTYSKSFSVNSSSFRTNKLKESMNCNKNCNSIHNSNQSSSQTQTQTQTQTQM